MRTTHSRLPRLLTTKQLATELEIPASTIYYWRHKGIGPRAFKVGRELRFAEADVLRWLAQKRAAAT
jgi:excisionase family DNA binding protein